MPIRRCVGQQRVPWGERQAERDAGHLAQQLAPGTCDARGGLSDNLLCKFVHTHSAHLTLRGYGLYHLKFLSSSGVKRKPALRALAGDARRDLQLLPFLLARLWLEWETTAFS